MVAPALVAGRHVVTDRFAGSSMAYQGYGRGLPVDEVRRLSEWATEGVWPDLVVLLEVAAERGRPAARPRAAIASSRRATTFHRRVADGFRALAAADPRPLGGRRRHRAPIDEVEDRVRAAVAQRLQLEA